MPARDLARQCALTPVKARRSLLRQSLTVPDAEAPRRLAMESVGTQINDRASGRHIADIEVWIHVDLRALGLERTELMQTVVIDMRNTVFKVANDVMAFATGTRELWEQQFIEEPQVPGAFAERHVMTDVADDA